MHRQPRGDPQRTPRTDRKSAEEATLAPHNAGTAPSPRLPAVTLVTKTMKPQQPGSRRWRERYGERLVCVRYREDAGATHRYITVELLVESARIQPQRPVGPVEAHTADLTSPRRTKPRPDPIVQVRIEHHEFRLRQKAYAAGATCHPTQPVWHMPLTTARALRVLRRIVEEPS